MPLAPARPVATTAAVIDTVKSDEVPTEARYNASTYRGDFLTVTRSKTSLDLDGWHLAAQRHSVKVPATSNGRNLGWQETIKITCVRLSDPTGRVLHLMLDNARYAKDERGALTTSLSAPIGALLRDNLSPKVHRAGMVALANVFEVATALAQGADDHGIAPQDLVTLAAHSVDIEATGVFLDRLWTLVQASGGERVPATRNEALGAFAAAHWVANGVTAEQVWAFASGGNLDLRYTGHHLATAASIFARHGWTLSEYQTIYSAVEATSAARATEAVKRAKAEAWAPFPATDAIAAAQAGLTPEEVLRLRQAGTWDADSAASLVSLAALAALAAPTAPRAA